MSEEDRRRFREVGGHEQLARNMRQGIPLRKMPNSAPLANAEHHSMAYKLLSILQSHARTGSEQEACAELFRQASIGGYRTTETEMARLLYRGLKEDIWPWTQEPERCEGCGRLSGMPSAPCSRCPDKTKAAES
jgi:hypothetical protein